ncbi:MAG TPA: TMEM43 family protein [Thermoanaerobaculaceae bacterium]|nr:TMEM43 family protein [Thermoanaerobaculaceae bacterium]HPS77350.1 TMEM43 family protein [Thermoanaerobaculaceae bacterium]
MPADTYTEVTSRSWGSKLGSSIKGVFGGLVIAALGVALLWWNEGRAVTTARGLKEGASVVVSVAPDRVDAANEGKLVHMTGVAATTSMLSDPDCSIQVQAIALRRTVEMYQWKEEKKSETKKKLGGGDETVTTYSYSRVWSEEAIDSGAFKKPEGHANPATLPLSSEIWRANQVMLGAFSMGSGLIGQMKDFVPLPPPDPTRTSVPAARGRRAQVSGSSLYLGPDPGNPQVGDLRLSFSQVLPATVSVIAQQTGGSLAAYQTKAGPAIQMLKTGAFPAEAMFKAAMQSNRMITWLLRLFGFFLVFVGLKAFLGPLVALGDVVPFIGNIIGGGTSLVAFLGAAVISLVVIALAWLVYRPVLTIGLLAVALVALVLILRRRKASPPPLPAAR